MTANLNTVDLRLLRVFTAVVDCGGFSAAQVALNVSQSTISTQMADLEARLGARLGERGRAGFSLTDAGRCVYEASGRLFRALDAFASEVGALRGRLVGELHVGAIDNMISNPDCRLDDAIARFKGRAGAVHLNLHVAPPLEIERAVLDGRFYVGIGTFPNHAPGLAYSRLFAEEMNLYCGRGHPFFGRDDAALDVAEIEGAEYARRGYATAARTGRLRPRNVTATAFNMEAIATLVLSGRFTGHLPTHYTTRWVEQGLMRPLKPRLFRFDSPFEFVVRRGAPRSAAIEMFIADLVAAFAPARRAGGAARARA
ncbi:MAG: LysR family transcriptional regulator [Alphaproteobacteria bacterium]